MTIVLSIIIAIVGYFILIFIGTNLVGMVVRGFFQDTELTKMREGNETHPAIKKEIARNDHANVVVTIVSIIFLIVFLFLLYKYINIWADIAVLILMVGRIPDLLWEIKHGQKINKMNMPKGLIYVLTSIMDWLALPILFWAIYTLLV